jgi:hypothetical protein
VKSATKNQILPKCILGKNRRSWAKVKRADQKWKALPQKQNLPNAILGKNQKS